MAPFNRKPAPEDLSIKVQVNMPASVYQRLREHAAATGTSISKLCRDGALAVLAAAEPSAAE